MHEQSTVCLIGALFISSTLAVAQQPLPLDSPQYELVVNIIPELHRLDASGNLRLAPIATARDSIQVRLSGLVGEPSVEVVEPAESRGKANVERLGRPGSSGVRDSTATTWTIVPTSLIPAGKAVLLRIAWSGTTSEPGELLYVGNEVCFGSGFSTAWYPQYLDLAGGTMAGTGHLTFHVPKGFSVVADGAPEMESAASGEFQFVAKAPTFFSFAAARYTVVHKDGLASISAYLLRPRSNTQAYLDGCARILERLSKEYGPDPYGKRFSVVEIPIEKFSGSSGASFPNFIFINSASLDAPFNPILFGHEIGHIWWGNLVKLKGARGRYMLDEGMAQYSALVALEELAGAQMAQRFRQHGDPASPIEASASTYFALTAAGLDHPLSELPNNWNSRNLVNSKAPFVVDLLSRTIGPERFREILQKYLKEHAFQKASWEQFAEAFDSGTQGRSQAFFAKWFDTIGAPDWRLTWIQDGDRIRGTVSQDSPGFGATVDVEIRFVDGHRVIKHLEIKDELRTDFNWDIEGKIQDVVLDPNYRVLHWTTVHHTEARLLAPYWKAFVRDDTEHEAALADLANAIRQIPENDAIGMRFMLEELTARLLTSDDRRLAEAQLHLQRALMSASRRTERLGWAYWLLGYIASKTGDAVTLETAVQGAVASDVVMDSWSGWGAATKALRASNGR